MAEWLIINNNNINLENIQKISNNVSVKHEIRERQKAVILCTTPTLRAVLM